MTRLLSRTELLLTSIKQRGPVSKRAHGVRERPMARVVYKTLPIKERRSVASRLWRSACINFNSIVTFANSLLWKIQTVVTQERKHGGMETQRFERRERNTSLVNIGELSRRSWGRLFPPSPVPRAGGRLVNRQPWAQTTRFARKSQELGAVRRDRSLSLLPYLKPARTGREAFNWSIPRETVMDPRASGFSRKRSRPSFNRVNDSHANCISRVRFSPSPSSPLRAW